MRGTPEKVLVLGLGRSGCAASRLLIRGGARVVGYDRDPERGQDLEGLEKRLCGPDLPSFEGFDRVVQSPGVPVLADPRLLPEVELAAELLTAPLVGVTGTNGKSTVTVLITEMMRRSGLVAVSGGNLGTPLCEAVGVRADRVVAELSSFQLEHVRRLRVAVAVLLNLAPDHLDRHGTLEAYGAAKSRIAERQGPDDFLVYNADDPWARAMAERSAARRLAFSARRTLSEGAFLKDAHLLLVTKGETRLREPIESVALAARSPVDNALAACAAAFASGAGPEGILDALRTFEGLPHRGAFVCLRGGVRYVNDSKGTNPAAAARMLEASGEPIVWIAGGRNKGLDLARLRDATGAVRVAVVYGEAAADLERILTDACPVLSVAAFDDAFQASVARARPGDTVLLSPACASQDQFASFEERGARFADLARALPDARGGRPC